MTTASANRSFPRSFISLRGVLLTIGGAVFGLVLGGLFVGALAVQFFDFQIVRVQTGSMTPTYSQGDLVVIRPAKASEIEAGDVILFTANTGSSVLHRVIAINTINTNIVDQQGNHLETVTERRFITQGDANPVPDAGNVRQQDLEGAVWFSVPGLGGADELTLQAFLLAGAGLIVITWILYEGYKFTGRRDKKKKAAASAPPSSDDG